MAGRNPISLRRKEKYSTICPFDDSNRKRALSKKELPLLCKKGNNSDFCEITILSKMETVNKAAYVAPGIAFLPIESNLLLCLSDGEHEGVGEEPWG